MSNIALRLSNITKRFGDHCALDDVSLDIPEGCICGLVGPNGAGKTTAFSVIAGFLNPDEGEVDILGDGAFDPYSFKGRIGILPQDAILPNRHTPRGLLSHLAQLQGLSSDAARVEARQKLTRVGLADRMDHAIHTLSHGMQRRVAVASALVGDPELVLLDEPLAGLDPRQAGNVRSALAELRGKRTLIVSSHNLSELERLCDWVVMMDHGSIVEQGPMADVTGRGDVIRWDIGEHELQLDALRETLAGHLFVRTGDIVEQQTPAQCDIDAVTLTVMRYLVNEGVPVRNVSRGQSLERAFFDSTASSPPSAGGAAEGN